MLPPEPFSKDNIRQWVRVKSIDEQVKKMGGSLRPYSIYVPNIAYSTLSISKRMANNIEYDVIELGCKIEVENRTNKALFAYGGCYFYDEHLSPVTDSNIVRWDPNETGIMIPPNTKISIGKISSWSVDKNVKPYPTTRIKKVDYELFLRHDKAQE
jgi:hypothetical protein